jgi:hypothetical protein
MGGGRSKGGRLSFAWPRRFSRRERSRPRRAQSALARPSPPPLPGGEKTRGGPSRSPLGPFAGGGRYFRFAFFTPAFLAPAFFAPFFAAAFSLRAACAAARRAMGMRYGEQET